MIALAELYRKGLPPVAGGTLDQAAAFNDAARFVWAEMDRIRAEAMSREFRE